jgi:hypothetical protein
MPFEWAAKTTAMDLIRTPGRGLRKELNEDMAFWILPPSSRMAARRSQSASAAKSAFGFGPLTTPASQPGELWEAGIRCEGGCSGMQTAGP